MSNEEDREALRAAFMAGRRERIRARPEWANDETETMPYPTGDEDEYMADAVLAAGFHRTPAPAPDVQALIAQAWEAHLRTKREPRQGRRSLFVAGWEAARAASRAIPQDTEWEYQCQLADNPWTEVADRTHGINCSGRMLRRRKAGPWEPVPTEGMPE